MKSFGLARLGRDAEIRTTSQGESVATLALAFSYGRKGSDGNRPTQWVDAALWGKRAEALAPYLVKGGLVSVSLEDVHIETFDGKNGTGHKLAARVVDVELASPKQASAAAPAPEVTSLIFFGSLPATFRPLRMAAPTTMAVPCWSS